MPRRVRSPYDAQWRKVRVEVLIRDEYRCFEPGCDARATTVDHIIPVEEMPELRLERSNLRASCVKHNMGRPSRRLAEMARVNRSTATVRAW